MTLSILTERGHQANICIRSVLKLSIPKRSGARWKNSNIDLETHFLPETSFCSHLKMSRPWGVPPGAAKDTWLIHIHAIPIRSCPPADHSKPCICTAFALLGDNSEQFSALIELNSKQAFGGRLYHWILYIDEFFKSSKVRFMSTQKVCYKELQITKIKSAEIKFCLILDWCQLDLRLAPETYLSLICPNWLE